MDGRSYPEREKPIAATVLLRQMGRFLMHLVHSLQYLRNWSFFHHSTPPRALTET
ncbi:hypothetical protein KSX_86810 [Ktedonospora formicarum]|uniref:Uncharacterized protein n=1 Tax=Ktedonospora formicarum TaxID=2778364 RepID=A0A8J3MY81_9CHLR|nr:hypothetical protein KSX_86810 [Ktedonospora formicarum]